LGLCYYPDVQFHGTADGELGGVAVSVHDTGDLLETHDGKDCCDQSKSEDYDESGFGRAIKSTGICG
jgi:hypothetical protein